MNFNTEFFKKYFRTIALKAVPEIEKRALEWLAQNGKTVFGDRREEALKYIMEAYKIASARVPLLALTDMDDKLVREYAEQALDWAWGQLEDIVHEEVRVTDPLVYTPAPVADGKPATAEQFGPSLRDTINQD